MLEYFKFKKRLLTAKINTHEPYPHPQFEKELEYHKGWKKGITEGLGHLESFQERIEQLKQYYIHISIVSESFKLDPERKFDSSFRGIVHYLDKNNEWTFTDTGTYYNIFECIEETIKDAEYIKSDLT